LCQQLPSLTRSGEEKVRLKEQGQVRIEAEFLEPFGDIEACAKRGNVRAANQLWLNHTLFAPARENPEVEHKFAEMVGEYSGWHWANKDPIRPNDRPAIKCLRQIRAPTLVLVGERDTADFRAIADILARDIPGPFGVNKEVG
jgi:pimeloyl-ACP methyl ester carboxylesterase